MSWQLTPYALPSLIAGMAGLAVAGMTWREREAPSRLPLLVLVLAATEWSLFQTLEIAATELPAKMFFAQLQYIGILTTPIAWLTFAAHYTGLGRWLTRRRLLILSAPAFVTLVLVFTNQHHGLIWTDVRLVTLGRFVDDEYTHGVAFWMHTAYVYALFVAAFAVLMEAVIQAPRAHRGKFAIMALAAGIPWIANGIHLAGLNPFPIDLTPISFAIAALLVALALFRYRLLDLRPVARTLLVERTSDAMIVIDTRRRIVDLNPSAERIMARTLRDAIGLPIDEVFPELSPAIAPFGPTHHDLWLGPPAARRSLEVRLHGLDPTVSGENLGHLIVLHDTTALREAQSSMRQSETMAMLGSLMVGVAHEVRNPLFSLTATIDVFQQRFPRHADSDAYIERLRSHTQRIADVTSALLQYGKPVERERVQRRLEEVIREAAEACAGFAARKDIEISTTIAGPLASITMDRLRLVELFVNLIENAVHHTPTGGRIDISAAEVTVDQFRAVLCSVKDTGSGFKSADLTRIFEPFYTSRKDGIGMGLAISQRIAKDHDAEIVAYDAPDGGALLQVSFRLEGDGGDPD